MSDVENSIELDKKQHPKCGYSKQYSRECRTVNGKTKCEEIQRVFRVCPKCRPVEIASTEVRVNEEFVEDTYEEEEEGDSDLYGEHPRSLDNDMEQAFQSQMMGLMQLAGMMMSGFSPSPVAEEDSAEDFGMQQSPRRSYQDDYAPVHQKSPQPVMSPSPSISAPHTGHKRSRNAIPRKENALVHKFSDFEGRSKEF